MSLISSLAKKLNTEETTITQFLLTAPRKYKVYNIPKRTQGLRYIAQPSKELKEYQRAFLDIYSFPTHSCSMAYHKGLSIKENAQAHCHNTYFLKMDFENFFNSIKPYMIWDAIENSGGNTLIEERKWLEKLLFWQPSRRRANHLILSIGAPSSPAISNLCMYTFDEKLFHLCAIKNITYTRYADDLTFSTKQKEILFAFPLEVKKLLYELFGTQIIINTSKTVFSSKAHNRHVTGITINNNNTLSLGRKRKRYIKHLVHQFILGKLHKEDLRHLQGLLSFSAHIEPTFITTLHTKYTRTIMQQIIEARI